MKDKKLRIKHYQIPCEKNGAMPERPFRIAVLADLHNEVLDEHQNEKLIQAIDKEKPAFILSAGDLIVGKAGHVGTKNALSLLKNLTGKYPVYAVDGNHEYRMSLFTETYADAYERYTDRLKQMGVHLVNNCSENVTVEGMNLQISGFVVPLEEYRGMRGPKLSAERIKEAVGDTDDSCYRILLGHQPEYFTSYVESGADLILSGHVHGGIVRLPLIGGVINPNLHIFPRYDYGYYEKDGKRMIISGGLGCHTLKLRINNPRELVILDMCIPGNVGTDIQENADVKETGKEQRKK